METREQDLLQPAEYVAWQIERWRTTTAANSRDQALIMGYYRYWLGIQKSQKEQAPSFTGA